MKFAKFFIAMSLLAVSAINADETQPVETQETADTKGQVAVDDSAVKDLEKSLSDAVDAIKAKTELKNLKRP